MGVSSITIGNVKSANRCWICLVAFVVVAQIGCRHIGPKAVVDDRLPYNEAVAESWKEQTLLNLVKLRYSDTIAFTEVSQIISGHAFNRSGGVEIGTVPGVMPGLSGSDRFRALFNLRASVSDRPTVTYTPQTGSRFLRKLGEPLPPELVLFFVEAGYPADIVLDLAVESINGVRNRSSSGPDFRPADPEFKWMLQVLRRSQLNRGVSMRVKLDKEQKQTTVLLLRAPSVEVESELEEELLDVRKLLNLDLEKDEYKVVSGALQIEKDEIAIQTRSVFRVLSGLSKFVQVPEKHLCDGSARSFDLSGVEEPPLTVHCGNEPPVNCYAAIPYRGCWYWIDDCDVNSKRTFIYLFILLAQSDREPSETLPLVTIPINDRKN